MKHRTCPLRAALAAALVLVMLCVPALAAEIAVDYTSEYRFTAADFSDSDGLEGVYISSVPPAYQAELLHRQPRDLPGRHSACGSTGKVEAAPGLPWKRRL